MKKQVFQEKWTS